MSERRRTLYVQAFTRLALELAAIDDELAAEPANDAAPAEVRRPELAPPRPMGVVDDVARQKARTALKARGFKVTA